MISVDAFFTRNARSDSLHVLEVEIRDRRKLSAGAAAVLKFPQLGIKGHRIDAAECREDESQDTVFVPLLGNVLPQKMRDGAEEKFRQTDTPPRHLAQFARDLK